MASEEKITKQSAQPSKPSMLSQPEVRALLAAGLSTASIIALLSAKSTRNTFRDHPQYIAGLSIGALGIVRFFAAGGRCRVEQDLTGKIAIITGANTGIGQLASFSYYFLSYLFFYKKKHD